MYAFSPLSVIHQSQFPCQPQEFLWNEITNVIIIYKCFQLAEHCIATHHD